MARESTTKTSQSSNVLDDIDVIKDIVEFKTLCTANNIKLTIVYTPRHYKTLISRNHPELIRFKKKLAEKTDFYDFAVIADETTNNRLWNEASHFYADLGDHVLTIITDNGSPPGKFGALVTRDNVNEHLSLAYTTLIAKLPYLMNRDKNIYLGNGLQSGNYSEIFTAIEN